MKMPIKAFSSDTTHRPAHPGRLAACLALSLAMMTPAVAQTPSILSDHATYFAGEDILISFEDGPGNQLDWIGIYPEGIDPGPTPSTRWYYVDNTEQGNLALREGTLTFGGGLNLAGNYFAFFLENDTYTKLAETAFTVVDPGWPLARTDKRRYVTSEAISVTFTNGPANPLDWVAIYKEGETPGGGPSATLWSYVDGTQVGSAGLADGTVNFATGLAAAGNYVLFFLQNDLYDVLASEPFTVTAAAATTPRVISIQPAPGAQNQPPNVVYTATIANGTSKVVAGSVELSLNSNAVTHHFALQNDQATVTYTNSALYPAGAVNTFQLVFADDASPANRFTNEVTFTIADYRNIVLPAPLYFENFDSTPEEQLPAGWSQISYTEALYPDGDLGNLDSASYAIWIVVAADRFTGSFVTYSNPDNPDDWETDYQRVLSVNPLNVVNGQVFDQPLASGRFAFGNSGYRNGVSQVVYLFSPDFDLTGKTNVHLSFHSLWEQNQDSIAAVEYSVDQGQTWLPIAYWIDRLDIVTTTNEVTGEVTTDALATFTTEHADVARYTDPDTFEEKGGTYGAFIGAALSQDLAPFIEGRVDDDPVESKRIELYRLAQADNQARVRFRFAHAGTDSWYFGVDDFGLYSLGSTPAEPPTLAISRSGDTLTISWPANASGFVLEASPTVSPAAWTALSGVTGNSTSVTPSGAAMFYRLRQ